MSGSVRGGSSVPTSTSRVFDAVQPQAVTQVGVLVALRVQRPHEHDGPVAHVATPAAAELSSSMVSRTPCASGVLTGRSASMCSGRASSTSSLKVIVPAASGSDGLDRGDHVGDVLGRAAQVAHGGAVAGRARGLDEHRRCLGRVLELRASSERDLVALAVHGGGHRQRRTGGHPVIASRPVDDVGPQPDAADAVVLPVDPRRPLIRELVDAVVGDGMAVGVLGHADAVGAVVHGGRAGVGEAGEAPALDRLEHVDRAHDVDERAARWVGGDERHEHRRQMHDVVDLPLRRAHARLLRGP